MQTRQEVLERSARQRAFCGGLLGRRERIQSVAPEHLIGLVGEQHRVTVERDAKFRSWIAGRPRCKQRRGGDLVFERVRDVVGIGRQEQVAPECLNVTVWPLSATKRCACDVETVRFDRIEDAQARVGRIARQQDDFNSSAVQQLIDVRAAF